MHDRAKFLDVAEEQQNRMDVVRSSFSKMYDVIDINCKNNRETLLGIERLEEAQYWLIKGITREGK